MDNKKKIELKLEVHDDKGKQKAMKAVSSLQGIESISVDMKDNKMTVIGDVDPVCIVSKLRKCGHAAILTVGPAKDPKEEEKKKKEAEEKKKKEEAEKKKKAEEEAEKKRLADLAAAYNKCYIPYCPPRPPPYYCAVSCEENPNSCVIM